MTLDLSKLTPAPWRLQCAGSGLVIDAEDLPAADCGGDVDAQFIALARNAFDVMMRRSWGVRVTTGVSHQAVFHVHDDGRDIGPTCYTCPFTALVETDKWANENPDLPVTDYPFHDDKGWEK